MPESFSKSGKTWTWDASIHSDNLPDGPVTLVILAFDVAGNVNGTTINTFVSNNAPRVAKLYLATDLNDNNKFETDEFEEYSLIGKEGKSQDKYILDFSTFGTKYGAGIFTAKNKLAVVPEIVGGNGIISLVTRPEDSTVTSAEAVTKEAVGTELPSIASGSSIATTTQNDDGVDVTTYSASVAKTASDDISPYTITASNFAASDVGNNFFAYVLDNNQLTGKTNCSEADDGERKNLSFTFWDSTELTKRGTDSQKAVILVKGFTYDLTDGKAPTTVINPFYWKNLNSNSIYGSGKKDEDDAYLVKKVEGLAGHIELENDIKDISAITDVLESDPKVSGKITFTGTAYDEHSLASLAFTFSNGTVTPFSNVTMATYVNTTSKWTPATATIGTDGYEVTITETKGSSYGVFEDSVYFGQKGHKIYWTLSINTEKISAAVAKDMVLSVTATDLAGHTTSTEDSAVSAPTTSAGYIPGQELSADVKYTVTDGTTNKPTYQMDVVPYVTKVYTNLAKSKNSNWSVYNRTALGHYPVQSVVSNIDTSIDLKTKTSEDVTLYGFNLNASTAKIVSGSNEFTTEETDALKITNGVDATSGMHTLKFNVAKLASGELNLTVGDIPAMNNINENSSKGAANGIGDAYVNCYNHQSNGDTSNIQTDDVWFDVWEFNDRAAIPINGTATGICMEVNQKTGMLNYAFANGGTFYSMGGNTNKQTEYSATDSYSSYYWAGDYDTFAGPCVGFHVDELGYTYSVDSGGDTNTSGSVDKWVLYSSRWGALNRDYSGTLNGNSSLRLEEIALKLGEHEKNLNYSLMKYRYLSPEFASTVNGTNTNLYLVYYDALCNQIRFRAGKFTKTDKEINGGYQDEYTNGASSYYKTNNCQIIANGASGGEFIKDENGTKTIVPSISERGAGQYVDVAVVKVNGKDVVCVVWYDADANCCKFSYITDPITNWNSLKGNATAANWNSLKGNATAANWSTPVTVFDEGGEYCHIVADKNNHLHIAAYAGNGDVMYAYIATPTTSKSDVKTCTVDASGAVGEHLTLDVAVNSKGHSIPYIGYYTSAIKKPKFAYLVDPSVENATATFNQVADGVDSDERFTGAWEVTVVPTPSRMTANREDKVNVGVWKNAGVLTNSTSGTSQSHNSGSGYSSTNWSKTFGNGTANGVLGYQIATSSGTGLETAQMR